MSLFCSLQLQALAHLSLSQHDMARTVSLLLLQLQAHLETISAVTAQTVSLPQHYALI
jgi:hypothetical protein